MSLPSFSNDFVSPLLSGCWWWNGQSSYWYRPARYVWVDFYLSAFLRFHTSLYVPMFLVVWSRDRTICNFRLLITSSSGLYFPMRTLTLCTTVLLATLCFQVIPRILRKQGISYAITLWIQVSQPYSAIEVTSDLISHWWTWRYHRCSTVFSALRAAL